MELALDYFIYWVSGFSISLFLYFGIGTFAFYLFWKWKKKDIFSKGEFNKNKERIGTNKCRNKNSIFFFVFICSH